MLLRARRFPKTVCKSRPQKAAHLHGTIMSNYFESPFLGIPLDRQVTNPNIVVGRYSYYSGYYHGHSFDDCARYLMTEPGVDRLVIGAFCSIGSGAAFIMAGNQGHRNDWISTFPFAFVPEAPEFADAQNAFQPAGDTVIGNDVWIGSEAIIMPGVQVGHGAVIGTRALVTKDVEPYTIVGGNPAKPIRKRFADEDIALLLEIAWWDWPVEKLSAAMPLLTSADIKGLYAFWRQG
jgi:chloramphenicol O-acetyltransferase type B